MRHLRRRWISIAAMHAIAMAIGAAVALAGGRVDVGSAHAANHCTRYAPIVSQDTNCDLQQTMYSTGEYDTPSTALRDANYINLAASRNFAYAYSTECCWNYGTGTAGSEGSSGGYAVAKCAIGGASVTGRCKTNWHD
jgi:hypothetical protein